MGSITWLEMRPNGWRIGMIATTIRTVPKKNPTGPAQGEKRVLRGGSWADLPLSLRVTARVSAEPEYEDRTIGFRCAMNATQ